MTDVVRADEPMVITPLTGEAVLLSSPTDTLADWLHRIRQAEADIRDAKRTVTAELLDRMDKDAVYTARLGGFEIKGDGPSPVVEYDAERLRTELHLLVRDEVITERAMDNAVEIVQTYKAKANGINALHKLGGRVAAAIDACKREVPRDRRITVKERA